MSTLFSTLPYLPLPVKSKMVNTCWKTVLSQKLWVHDKEATYYNYMYQYCAFDSCQGQIQKNSERGWGQTFQF